MSDDLPARPDASGDLARAYARAHELTADGRGPSAAVRANVLAAARAVAAEAAARTAEATVAEPAAESAATLPLTPVAPPVADVGRGRPKAINLSSWRVRSGAALAAVALVAVAGWRLDARRFVGGEQVAVAELRIAEAPTSRIPKELPMPAMSGASSPYLPPPVVDEPADSAPRPPAKQATRDKDVIVAQADPQAERARAAAVAPAAAVTPAHSAQPAAAPQADAAAQAPPAAPVVSNTPDAKALATEQDPVTVTIKAAPVQLATAPAMPPSVLQRRVAVVPPAAKAPSLGETTVAAADVPQRVETEGSRPAFSSAGVSDALKKATPNATGSLMTTSARVLPSPLHAAADRGDVEALRHLLADPALPVDAPDSIGRTALLHAVLARQPAAVRLLLAAGADPAHADRAGLTPRAAAQTGASAEIATLLAAPR